MFSQVITIITFVGLIVAIAKNPFKMVKDFLEDYKDNMLYDIINFEQDLHHGEVKTDIQYQLIMKKCEDYKKSGGNGPGSAAYDYIKNRYTHRNG